MNFSTLYSRRSTFPYITSCHLHNNPVKYKLPHFIGEDKASIELLALCYPVMFQDAAPTPDCCPQLLGFLPCLPATQNQAAQSPPHCFPRELAYLAPSCSTCPPGVPSISPTGGLLHQLPWKLLTATFRPANLLPLGTQEASASSTPASPATTFAP